MIDAKNYQMLRRARTVAPGDVVWDQDGEHRLICVRVIDIPKEYWRNTQRAWLEDGITPRFNGGDVNANNYKTVTGLAWIKLDAYNPEGLGELCP